MAGWIAEGGTFGSQLDLSSVDLQSSTFTATVPTAYPKNNWSSCESKVSA
jgi:hypothetical protein